MPNFGNKLLFSQLSPSLFCQWLCQYISIFGSRKDKNFRTVGFHGQILELQVTVQCSTKVCELRYSMYVAILLMEQSLCFPKL